MASLRFACTLWHVASAQPQHAESKLGPYIFDSNYHGATCCAFFPAAGAKE